jgi:hypothetical protein
MIGGTVNVKVEIHGSNTNQDLLQYRFLNKMKNSLGNSLSSNNFKAFISKVPTKSVSKPAKPNPTSKKQPGKQGKKILKYYKIVGVNKKIPTIGLLCGPQPIDSLHNIQQAKCDYNTIQWLYQSGAEVVPILPWTKPKQLNIILSKIHGIVFPAGSRFLGVKNPLAFQYEKFAHGLFNRLMELNKKGVYTPLLGIGQGFELMQIIIAKTGSIIEPTKGTFAISLPQFIFQDPKKHRIFSLFDKSDLFNFKSRRTTSHFHKFGVMSATYKKNDLLKRFFKITSYGVDELGKVFVSGIEALKFPFYGLHFQPEVLSWDRHEKSGIFHSVEGLRISQKLGNFFVQECKKNPNKQVLKKDFVKLGRINIHSRNVIKRPENHYWFYNSPTAGIKKGQILRDWRDRNKNPKPKPPKSPKKNNKPKVPLPPTSKKANKPSTFKKNAVAVTPPNTVPIKKS